MDPAPQRSPRVRQARFARPRTEGIEDSGADYDAADLAVLILRGVVQQCSLPGLASFGLSAADIPELAEASLRSSSMKGNPVALSADEIAAAILAAF